ncbi:MAG: BspA family leucine-rich repeat surface protein, partial [Cyclobacteriaceae bacterium]
MNLPRLIKPIYVLAFLLVGLTPLQLAAQNAACDNAKLILNEGTQTETNTGQNAYWYHYQVPPPGQGVSVAITNVPAGVTVKVYNTLCLNLGSPIATGTSSLSVPNVTNIFISFDKGGSVFNLGTFDFNTSTSGGGPINNICEDAIVITANGTQTVNNTGEAEYWYQFVMPSTPSNLELSSDPGANIAVTVYTGADCNSLTIRAQGTSANVLTVTTLTPNSVVWIKWAAQLGTTGSFVLNALPTGGGGGGSNQAPTNIALDKTTLNNSDGAFTVVGNLSTTDPDANDTFTYTLVSGTGSTDNASFDIMPLPVSGGAQLLITVDANTKASYSVRIRSTDLGGLSFEKAFTITVNAGGGNNAPTDIALSATSINENVAANSTVGTLSTTDPDNGNTFTYSLTSGTGSTDNASFSISGNSLKITNSPDFETKNSYSVRIRTTDQDNLTFEKSFTISINNVNEAPTDLALSANAINENVAANSTVGTLSSTDPDAANTFTYALAAGTGDTDNSAFTIDDKKLNIKAIPDFETKSSYSVRIRTTDQAGLFFEQQFTISILNVNEGEDPNAFITTWKPVEGKFTIPTATGSTYSYTVKVIDNTTNSTVHTSTNNTGNVTITGLDNAKIYTVEITGTFPRIYFSVARNLGPQILTVKQWGKIVWANMKGAFEGCSSLTIPASDAPDLSQVTDMSYMFGSAFAFNQPIGHWDVSNVTNMNNMFGSAYAFNQPIGNWNVSNVTDMSYMFYLTTAFNQPIGSWNVSKVTKMSYMFFYATAFNQSLANWVIPNNANLSFMLANSDINVANYDATLIGWSNLTGPGRSLGAGGLKYCNGEAARNTLISKGWIISGDVKDCSVNKSVQSITFSALSAKTFGDAKFALGATATSGLLVGYTATPAGILTFETDLETGINMATIVGTGTVTITAKQPGNQNYNAAPDVTQTLTVNKAAQTIAFNAITASIEVGGAAFALGATATSSLAVSYTATPPGRITIDANGNATPVGGGNVEITASQAGNNNYNAATSVKQTVCIAPVAPVVITQTQGGSAVLTTANAQVLSWFKDGTVNSIATGSVFNPSSQPTALGVYYAKVDAGNGCVSKPSNKFKVDIVTGLE